MDAYSIKDLTRCSPFSRSEIYRLIGSGRLRARKSGRKTIITDDDWQTFLASLPEGVAEPPAPAMAARRTKQSAPTPDMGAWITEADAIGMGIEAERLHSLSTLNGRYNRSEVEKLAGRG